MTLDRSVDVDEADIAGEIVTNNEAIQLAAVRNAAHVKYAIYRRGSDQRKVGAVVPPEVVDWARDVPLRTVECQAVVIVTASQLDVTNFDKLATAEDRFVCGADGMIACAEQETE